jgi:hypothetical protein
LRDGNFGHDLRGKSPWTLSPPRQAPAASGYCGLVLFSQACFIASWDIPVFCAFSCAMQSLTLFALLDEEDCDPEDEELLLL